MDAMWWLITSGFVVAVTLGGALIGAGIAELMGWDK